MGGRIGLLSEETHNHFSGFPYRVYTVGNRQVGVVGEVANYNKSPSLVYAETLTCIQGIQSPVIDQEQRPRLDLDFCLIKW